MTQARAKRLCQSSGLRVSQVLMCAVSVPLTEKIGHHTHFQPHSVWHKSYHPPVHSTDFPFLGGVRAVPISMTGIAGRCNHPCARLSESDEEVWCYAVIEYNFFLSLIVAWTEKNIDGELYSCVHGNSTINNSLEVILKKKKKGLGGFMVTLGAVEFLIGGLKRIQTWTIILFFQWSHNTSPPHKVGQTPGTVFVIIVFLFYWSLELINHFDCVPFR